MILFDAPTARDVLDAFRLLEGKLLGTRRQLSTGALELRCIAETSGPVRTPHAVDDPGNVADDGFMPALLTLDETAQLIRKSRSTVERLVAAGDLTAVHIGRSVRVRPSDLQAFIDGLPTSAPTPGDA